ncbi:MAG: peptidylprolyl isomerase [Flavipsychrobacter sp.]
MKKILLTVLCLIALTPVFADDKIVIYTDMGKIELVLFDNTPQHSKNMLKLVKKKFYDGTLFHRVIPQFMIQGGDPESKTAKKGTTLGNGDVGYRVPAEINDVNYHRYGALAMARDNNPEKASSGCQFYIVVGKKFDANQLDQMASRTGRKYTEAQKKVYATEGGTPHLDGNYTVFGQVTKGMDVVEKIIDATRDERDRPYEDIKMNKVRVKKFLGLF